MLWEVISYWGTLKSMQEKIGTKFYNLFHGVNFCWSLLRVWIYRRGRVTLNFSVLLHCLLSKSRIWNFIVYVLQNTQCTELFFFFLQKLGQFFFKFIFGTSLCMFYILQSAQSQFSTKVGQFFLHFFRLHCVCSAYYTVYRIVFYKTGQILCTICFLSAV